MWSDRGRWEAHSLSVKVPGRARAGGRVSPPQGRRGASGERVAPARAAGRSALTSDYVLLSNECGAL